ncbi:glycogen synthase kinase binding protein [Gouania willdenowi]|uniref:glycogen synthase kinase binding protein n=1 Tax=Gouania willdenowi TaxID=441366 RepID=UPI0010544C66|nr:GSK-3-binding protein FRAT2 [Gouania willdenowi]
MPCRKENYLLLESAVTVAPGDVDALVARIEDALQLTGTGGPQTVCVHGFTGTGGSKPTPGGPAAPERRRTPSCCTRLRGLGQKLRTGPYTVRTDTERSERGRSWRSSEEERLLQDLVLSGNLIKEAVRRLQLSVRTEPNCAGLPGPERS